MSEKAYQSRDFKTIVAEEREKVATINSLIKEDYSNVLSQIHDTSMERDNAKDGVNKVKDTLKIMASTPSLSAQNSFAVAMQSKGVLQDVTQIIAHKDLNNADEKLYIKKGEVGFKVIEPVMKNSYTTDEQGNKTLAVDAQGQVKKEISYFKVGTVFDISQTTSKDKLEYKPLSREDVETITKNVGEQYGIDKNSLKGENLLINRVGKVFGEDKTIENHAMLFSVFQKVAEKAVFNTDRTVKEAQCEAFAYAMCHKFKINDTLEHLNPLKNLQNGLTPATELKDFFEPIRQGIKQAITKLDIDHTVKNVFSTQAQEESAQAEKAKYSPNSQIVDMQSFKEYRKELEEKYPKFSIPNGVSFKTKSMEATLVMANDDLTEIKRLDLDREGNQHWRDISKTEAKAVLEAYYFPHVAEEWGLTEKERIEPRSNRSEALANEDCTFRSSRTSTGEQEKNQNDDVKKINRSRQ